MDLNKLFHTTVRILLFISILSNNAIGQSPAPPISRQIWKASWITVPGASEKDYGVYLFRKEVNLKMKPSSFVIDVSADNRYKLFINEDLISMGPAKGDLTHWKYETIDIAPYLKEGNNIIAAKVWNEAGYKPAAQISLRPAFILQGDTDAEQILNTGTEWKCITDKSYSPLSVNFGKRIYYMAGPGECIDMNKHITGWEKEGFDDDAWEDAEAVAPGVPKNVQNPFAPVGNWLLVPSTLPQMEQSYQRIIKVRETQGVTVPSVFPEQKVNITIPANTVATILLDQTYLTNAYPTLLFSGGKDGAVSLTYAEALFLPNHKKGNRDVVEQKTIVGRKDNILSNGKGDQLFIPLDWRTYRYIQIRVVTKNEPLIINDLYGTFIGYPFKNNAQFESDSPEINKILDIGWHTARLCATETYMDCPYYEQLQYVGDTRIQALISLYNSGDDRLVKNAITQIDNSRQPEGLTLSRYPSNVSQLIPPFSLWYIGMLHDYWMYGKDTDFVASKLAGMRQILHFFNGFQLPDGSLKDVPYWVFTDWVYTNGWKFGEAPKGKDGTSSVMDLQLLWAYQLAAEIENKEGMAEYSTIYQNKAIQLKKTILFKYWDDSRQLIADRSEKDVFSQHANVLAILTGVLTDEQAKNVAQQLVSDKTIAQASISFRFYLNQALIKAEVTNDYLSLLDVWRENIELGMTTWAETSDVNSSRSDCHAWGASPNIEFYRTVLGIDSDAPGFTKVKIEPHLGTLKNVRGEIPHPTGKIVVKYTYKNEKWNVQINLPETLNGTFIWKGKTYPLHGGKNPFLNL